METMQLNVRHWSGWMIAIGSLRKYHMTKQHNVLLESSGSS